MELIFATHNKHKVNEIADLAGGKWLIKSLADINFHEEIPETGDTLEDNALEKARFVHDAFDVNCFADDTGLEIDALNGAPGVFSARYAGPGKQDVKNVNKVLQEMKGISNRKACFRTVIATIINGETQFFEGIVEGTILDSPVGSGGFGYDPIFKPNEADVSFAEMSLSEKNQISHRGRAIKKLSEYLKTF